MVCLVSRPWLNQLGFSIRSSQSRQPQRQAVGNCLLSLPLGDSGAEEFWGGKNCSGDQQERYRGLLNTHRIFTLRNNESTAFWRCNIPPPDFFQSIICTQWLPAEALPLTGGSPNSKLMIGCLSTQGTPKNDWHFHSSVQTELD